MRDICRWTRSDARWMRPRNFRNTSASRVRQAATASVNCTFMANMNAAA